jgi:hypothetical protein
MDPVSDEELRLLRGRLTVSRRRCGKPSCRCAAGEPHESPALVVTEGGRSKTITLAEADVAEVTAALERYEAARAELDGDAERGLAALRARLAARRQRPLGPRRRRSDPQTPCPGRQRRLRRLLALPPRPGTLPRAPVTLRPQQRPPPGMTVTPEEPHPFQLDLSPA